MSTLSLPGRTTEIARESEEGSACVVVLEGDRPGRRVHFEGELSIGRAGTSGLAVSDPKVSREHAEIRFDGDCRQWLLTDRGSSNGTFVDGEPVTRRVLEYGAHFRVGGTLLLFTHHDRREEELKRRRKLEALGRMGAGIAHDFNQLITVIASSLEFLDDLSAHTPLGDVDVRACRSDMRVAARQAAKLTERLVGLAKGKAVTMENLDLADIVHEVAALADRSSTPDVHVETVVAQSLPAVGDPGQLRQALMNLCVNAQEALSPAGGTIRLEATVDHGSSGPEGFGTPHIRLRVSDDGAGMDEATQERLFEPFFTTKSERGGSGLGLANVYEVVSAHSGSVEVESTPGWGTTFTLRIPVSVAGRVTQVPVSSDRAGRLRVLVADDEPGMRRIMCRLLEHLGHETLTAENGSAALDVVRAYPAVDLAVLDLDMPVLDGERCFDALRRARPDIPVIFASAALRGRREELLAAGALAVLEKPVCVSQLREAVQVVVDRSKAMVTTALFSIELK